MRTIAVEEHFITPTFVAGPGKVSTERFRSSRSGGAAVVEKLSDVGDKRVAEMDAAGIDMQVLSLNSPGVEQSESDVAVVCARDANDFLADSIKRHPARFAGFASLPIQAPDKAAEELERCVRTLGFKGCSQFLDAVHGFSDTAEDGAIIGMRCAPGEWDGFLANSYSARQP
jgi:uncharacterized protein